MGSIPDLVDRYAEMLRDVYFHPIIFILLLIILVCIFYVRYTMWMGIGIGIKEEQQSRIFERFYRVDKSRSKETGGTGLGLSIVKHGAKLHNADIAVESELGQGTNITVTFPAKGINADKCM